MVMGMVIGASSVTNAAQPSSKRRLVGCCKFFYSMLQCPGLHSACSLLTHHISCWQYIPLLSFSMEVRTRNSSVKSTKANAREQRASKGQRLPRLSPPMMSSATRRALHQAAHNRSKRHIGVIQLPRSAVQHQRNGNSCPTHFHQRTYSTVLNADANHEQSGYLC